MLRFHMAADALTRAIARVLDRIHLGPRRKYHLKGVWWIWPGSKVARKQESHTPARRGLRVAVLFLGISAVVAIAIIAKSSGFDLAGDRADQKIDLYQPPKIAIAPQLPSQNLPSTAANAVSAPVTLVPLITQKGSASPASPGTRSLPVPTSAGGVSDSDRFLVVPNPIAPTGATSVRKDGTEDSPLVE